ncbi:MAG: hypothetical protein DMF06_06145 [Verrucomicrobia bacterium]|nr:MAG: hypothetical protein DMF06_06145 [Verrucomicrobiota bacterium]
MKHNRIRPVPLEGLDIAAHFKPGSALRQFMAGGLGDPSFWPSGRYAKRIPSRVPDETRWIHRWENEGGKTLGAAPPQETAFSSHHFHPARP